MRALNVFGEPILTCSENPMTGYFRDGCCETDEDDEGTHVVCAIMTDDFLQFSLSCGNDLISPRPIWQFPGLKAGDRWCLCANRWIEAHKAGKAPLIVLEATNEKILDYISINELIKFAYK